MTAKANLTAVVLLLLFPFASLAAAGATAVVRGKATVHQQPVAGVTVGAYPVAVATLSGPAPFSSGVTRADGLFSLTLPPGEYYFIARGQGSFCYYGRNPVSVPAEGLEAMNLLLVADPPPVPKGEPLATTGVLGQVTADGKPLAGAVVTVYTDLTTRLKGTGLGMAAPTGGDGMFEAELPPGTYYLVARLRRAQGVLGPLQAGDYIGYFPGNPVVVREGTVLRAAIPLLEVPAKVEKLADSLFGQTSIHGIIIDRGGKPVAGVRVFLYEDALMLNRPLYISQPSGADGGFVLSFPQGGAYYLSARDTMGGAPRPGELYGTYDRTPDHSIRLKTGEKKENVRITVQEMW